MLGIMIVIYIREAPSGDIDTTDYVLAVRYLLFLINSYRYPYVLVLNVVEFYPLCNTRNTYPLRSTSYPVYTFIM